MISICPTEPTAMEQAEKMITKNRYLRFRDDYSTTSRFGFRIEGIQIRPDYFPTTIEKAKIQSVNSLEAAMCYLKVFVNVSTNSSLYQNINVSNSRISFH